MTIILRYQWERICSIFLFFVYFAIVGICLLPQIFYDMPRMRRQRIIEGTIFDRQITNKIEKEEDIIRELEMMSQMPLVA